MCDNLNILLIVDMLFNSNILTAAIGKKETKIGIVWLYLLILCVLEIVCNI